MKTISKMDTNFYIMKSILKQAETWLNKALKSNITFKYCYVHGYKFLWLILGMMIYLNLMHDLTFVQPYNYYIHVQQ